MPNVVLFFYDFLSLSFISDTCVCYAAITKNRRLNFVNLIFVDLIKIIQLIKNTLKQHSHLVNEKQIIKRVPSIFV